MTIKIRIPSHISRDEEMVGLSHYERCEFINCYPPDLSKFTRWDNQNIFLIITSTDSTYFNIMEHYGKDRREDSSFHIYQKGYDDVNEMMKRVRPTQTEEVYIRTYIENMSGECLGFCPLTYGLYMMDMIFEDT